MPGIAPVLRRLSLHTALSDEDHSLLKHVGFKERHLLPDEPLGDVCAVLLQGMAGRFKQDENGEARLISVHFAGEWLNLECLHGKPQTATHALGSAKVGVVARTDLARCLSGSPRLSNALWRETMLDAAICRNALHNNASRTSERAMAHLICELHLRKTLAEQSLVSTYVLPMTQNQIAELLGMSLVTSHRAMSKLRSQNLFSFRRHQLQVADLAKLIKYSGFDARYLLPLPITEHVAKIESARLAQPLSALEGQERIDAAMAGRG